MTLTPPSSTLSRLKRATTSSKSAHTTSIQEEPVQQAQTLNPKTASAMMSLNIDNNSKNTTNSIALASITPFQRRFSDTAQDNAGGLERSVSIVSGRTEINWKLKRKPKRHSQEETFVHLLLEGELYKKRQGLTRLQAKVKARFKNQNEEDIIDKLWPIRRVELRNGVLTYFKITHERSNRIGIDTVTTYKQRGSVDLKRAGTYLRLSYPYNPNPIPHVSIYTNGTANAGMHGSGSFSSLPDAVAQGNNYNSQPQGSDISPTEFQFEIVYNNILKPAERVSFIFCCKDQMQFYTWVMAICHEIYSRVPSQIASGFVRAVPSKGIPPTLKTAFGGGANDFGGSRSMSMIDLENEARSRAMTGTNLNVIPVVDLNQYIDNTTPTSPAAGEYRPSALSIVSIHNRKGNNVDDENPTDNEMDSEEDLSSVSSIGNRKRSEDNQVDFNAHLRKLNDQNGQSEKSLERHMSSASKSSISQASSPTAAESPPPKDFGSALAATRQIQSLPDQSDFELPTVLRIELIAYILISQFFLLFLAVKGVQMEILMVSIATIDIFLIKGVLSIFSDSFRNSRKSMGENLTFENKFPRNTVSAGAMIEGVNTVEPPRILSRMSSGSSGPFQDDVLHNGISTLEGGNLIPYNNLNFTMPHFDPFAFDFLNDLPADFHDKELFQPSTWQFADHKLLKLRVGPNYKQNKEKAPSKSSFYVPIGLDMFQPSDGGKIDHVLSKLQIPFHKLNPKSEACKNQNIPDILVFNFQIPETSIIRLRNSSGPSYSFICYFAPSDAFINMVDKLDNNDASTRHEDYNAARLFIKWLTESSHNQHIKNQLKIMGYLRNARECGLPNWLNKFNGKPCMVTKSASMHTGTQIDPATHKTHTYLEIDVDLGAWGIIVKRALGSIIPKVFIKMHFLLGIVIQGDEDGELPERAIAAAEYYKMSESSVKMWPF